ncbi:hypothetical protein M5K25_007266 [Dendrobium thyrsiflorum]|uniref:RNase H type-1 domain-containing protein n=1 Tax=Dendrobium thyrsiflorum TaxID=117978 RepID=A0ABD0VEQ5_DENTH
MNVDFNKFIVRLNLGCNFVWVEVDAKLLIQIIENLEEGHPHNFYIIRKIKRFLATINYKIFHIYREANCCADWLAKFGCHLDIQKVFNRGELPHLVKGMVNLDKAGLPYIRNHISSPFFLVGISAIALLLCFYVLEHNSIGYYYAGLKSVLVPIDFLHHVSVSGLRCDSSDWSVNSVLWVVGVAWCCFVGASRAALFVAGCCRLENLCWSSVVSFLEGFFNYWVYFLWLADRVNCLSIGLSVVVLLFCFYILEHNRIGLCFAGFLSAFYPTDCLCYFTASGLLGGSGDWNVTGVLWVVDVVWCCDAGASRAAFFVAGCCRLDHWILVFRILDAFINCWGCVLWLTDLDNWSSDECIVGNLKERHPGCFGLGSPEESSFLAVAEDAVSFFESLLSSRELENPLRTV